MEKQKITKVYVKSSKRLTKNEACFLVSKNNCFPISIKKLSAWNWIVEIEYEQHKELLNLLKTKNVRNKELSVKRIFKSAKLSTLYKKEPSTGFLMQIAMGISGLIDKPVVIRIVNNRADEWQRQLTKLWQTEIDNPSKFKDAGIKNVIDISPKGKLKFCIVKTKEYVVTFFDEIIDEYTKEELDAVFPFSRERLDCKQCGHKLSVCSGFINTEGSDDKS